MLANVMNSSIRDNQLVAVIVVLVSTVYLAVFLEMKEMYENKDDNAS